MLLQRERERQLRADGVAFRIDMRGDQARGVAPQGFRNALGFRMFVILFVLLMLA